MKRTTFTKGILQNELVTRCPELVNHPELLKEAVEFGWDCLAVDTWDGYFIGRKKGLLIGGAVASLCTAAYFKVKEARKPLPIPEVEDPYHLDEEP